jgi:hypothetical protein
LVGKHRRLSYGGDKSGLGRVQGGALNLKQLLGYAVIAFLLFFVIKDPSGAAHIVNDIGNFLSSVARGFSSFLDSL